MVHGQYDRIRCGAIALVIAETHFYHQGNDEKSMDEVPSRPESCTPRVQYSLQIIFARTFTSNTTQVLTAVTAEWLHQ